MDFNIIQLNNYCPKDNLWRRLREVFEKLFWDFCFTSLSRFLPFYLPTVKTGNFVLSFPGHQRRLYLCTKETTWVWTRILRIIAGGQGRQLVISSRNKLMYRCQGNIKETKGVCMDHCKQVWYHAKVNYIVFRVRIRNCKHLWKLNLHTKDFSDWWHELEPRESILPLIK